MFAHNLESGEWEIATGAITQSAGVTGIISHVHVSDTRDGGFSDWLPSTSSRPLTRWSHEANTSSPLPAGWREAPQPAIGSTPDTLNARCHCIAIRFSVSRPTTQSSTFTAPWPDLIVPYFTNPSGVPTSQEKWWLRSNGTKYLAGTCTCRSCRVAAGNAEVVEWAFVPACNISITDTDVPSVLPGMLHREGEYFPKPLHTNIEGLTTYRSSDHATRHFCATCGASVFWSSPGRPELIDVAVGLFDAPEGARAEGWLEWWTERVSFGEEAEAGERDGGFVGDLIEGLRLWEEGRGEREEEARTDKTGHDDAAELTRNILDTSERIAKGAVNILVNI
ncbi:hypothetical protein LTR39_003236 [Cryomyces antarcticus]|nr:hypothetical protein LTR39_003236 [Cryomyces antarcticus]